MNGITNCDDSLEVPLLENIFGYRSENRRDATGIEVAECEALGNLGIPMSFDELFFVRFGVSRYVISVVRLIKFDMDEPINPVAWSSGKEIRMTIAKAHINSTRLEVFDNRDTEDNLVIARHG